MQHFYCQNQWYPPTAPRKSFGITSWKCAGVERLAASLDAGGGDLLVSVGFSFELPGPTNQVIVHLICQHR